MYAPIDGDFPHSGETKNKDFKTLPADIAWSSRIGDYKNVKRLLDLGKSPNAECDGDKIPLYEAIFGRHEDVIRLLAKRGADLTNDAYRCMTPLEYADSLGYEPESRLLKELINDKWAADSKTRVSAKKPAKDEWDE